MLEINSRYAKLEMPMKKQKTSLKKQHRRVVLYMIAIILLAIILEFQILSTLNRRSATKTTHVIVEQVEGVIVENERTEKELMEALKEEYIVRAQTAAYIMDLNTEIKNDIQELQKIANQLSVDEIHIFNKDGVLYSGTVKKYYGLTFDAGEQVAFFKPMLNDKSLSLCQDVTPNTAEQKNMMYAMTWDSRGEDLIQIGVEPVRLLNELKNNEISKVIADMPANEGIDIFVADNETGEILGATASEKIGKTLDEVGVYNRQVVAGETLVQKHTIDGFRTYCEYKQIGEYKLVVAYSTKTNLLSFMVAIILEFVYLFAAGHVILYMFKKVYVANEKVHENLSVLVSMSDIYNTMHLIDLQNDSVIEYNANDVVKSVINRSLNAAEMMRQVLSATTTDEYLDQILAFSDLTTVADRMQGKKIISYEFMGKNVGWCLASFITIEADEDGKPVKVVYVTRDINQQKKKEEQLIENSNTDELTGFRNRRAYEDDIEYYKDTVTEDDFVYVSMDVNGLKIVNDSLGHAAGDELIKGAAFCMKKALGSYGRLYRTGGDEFAAIIFAKEDELENIKKDLDDVMNSWCGEQVDSLTISCGYVAKRDVDITSVRKIAEIADERMYEAKTIFYREKGVDRRGQKEAHKALCELYTKILKINITNDTYQIVNMNNDEQTEDKGFANSISAWLSGFGKSGQVHEDDLEEYLSKTSLSYMRDYFNRDKTSLSIFYRRKYGDDYKSVMMEIIPSPDYENDNQNLFLYVKNIDK